MYTHQLKSDASKRAYIIDRFDDHMSIYLENKHHSCYINERVFNAIFQPIIPVPEVKELREVIYIRKGLNGWFISFYLSDGTIDPFAVRRFSSHNLATPYELTTPSDVVIAHVSRQYPDKKVVIGEPSA
jgi:hypothetical protein